MRKSIKDTQMKKSLGKLFIALLFITPLLQAQQLATYTLKAAKTKLYEKEGVQISFVAKQVNHTDNMFFLLHPKKSDTYKIILLRKTIDDHKYHDTTTTFTYLLFPLHSGTIQVDFDFIVRTASDRAVANSYVDDHDDSIAIQTTNIHFPVKPLTLEVKALEKDVDLVGDFQLHEKVDHTSITQYDSVNIIYTLEGKGYDEKTFSPLKSIPNVTLFNDTHDILNKATTTGYEIKREYIYALSAKESFTIPKITYKVFSPTSHRFYTLTAPAHHITVQHIDAAKLLDNEESPQSHHIINFSIFKQYAIYLLIFIMGYITAKMQNLSFKRQEKSPAYRHIQATDTPKKLLMTLINLQLEQKFSKEMKLLEEMVYNNAQHNFQKLKKIILKEV